MPSATSTDSLCSDVLSVDKRDLVPVTQLLSQKPVGATIGPGGPVDNQAVAQPGISLTRQTIENLLEGHHKGGRRSFLLPALEIAFRIPYGKAAVSHQIQNQAGGCEIALLEDPAIVVDKKGYLDAGTFLHPMNFRLEDGFLRRRGRTGNGAVGQLRVGFRRPLSGHGVPDEVQQKTLPEPIVPSDQIEARTESEIELLQRADIGCVQVFLSSFFPTNRLCPAYLYSGQVCRFALLPTGILVLYELEPRLAPRRNATSARPKRTVSKPQTVLKLSMRLV